MKNEPKKNVFVFFSFIVWADVPFKTCTRTYATSAFDGEHEYFPESVKSAFFINKYDVVISPLSVIIETPPRGES